MIAIYFFYGLAFLLMGLGILLVPKDKSLLRGMVDNFWLIGLFGLLHGANEWVDLFILRGTPFDVGALKVLGGLLLPGSFLCLVLFGTRGLVQEKPKLKRLRYLWIVCLAMWLTAYLFGKGSLLVAGIAARYFICVPGAFLSAYVLADSFRRNRRETFPPLFLMAAGLWITALALYGFLAGFVVPQAGFFPASVINHSTFLKMTGLPVQLFRMICALVMAVTCAIVAGIYVDEKDQPRLRGGIRTKILALVCGVVFLTTYSVALLSYWRGRELLRETIVAERKESANSLSILISNFITEEVEDVRAGISSSLVLETVQRANEKYGSLERAEVLRRLQEKDPLWADASEDSSFVKEFLEGALADELRNTIRQNDDIVELFVTDQFGGLVAASEKTSDFYQADESWWVRAFNGGRGAVIIDQIGYDESSKTISLPIALPIQDEKGGVAGVCKAVVSIDSFSTPLKKFVIGKTGHVEMLNEKGENLFHPGMAPLSMKLYAEDDFLKISKGKMSWLIARSRHEPDLKVVVWSVVENPWFRESRTRWYVVINQSADEMFGVLKTFIFQMAALSVFLIALMVPLAFFVGGRMVTPLKKLREAAERIAGGAMGRKIDLRTGDEIEALADAFNKMTADLEKTMVSRDTLMQEMDHRKYAEQEALAAKKDWEDSFDALSDMITIHDADFNILRANKAAMAGLGLPIGQILKKKCFHSFHGTECPPSGCPSCNVLKTGLPSKIEMFEPHLRKFLEVKAMPRFDADRKIIGLVHVVRDITEQKKAEDKISQSLKEETRTREIMTSMLEDNNEIREALEQNLDALKKAQGQLVQVQKMEAVGNLAGGIAHDFNNILTVIAGYVELLLTTEEARKPFEMELQEIRSATERAKNLVKQLLAFSRREMIAPKVFDPNVLLWELEKMLRRLLPEMIEFTIQYAERIGTIKADPSQIEQVLVNLIVNARDALPQGGKIIVTTQDVYLDELYADRYANIPAGRYVMISVSDNGCGMPEDVKSHAFEPFFTTKPKGQGTGLGLATSYGLIRQNHGHITIYSETGHGTVVKVYLPQSSEDPDLSIVPPKDENLPRGTETILVVEDESTLRKLTASMLARLGYKILEARDGKEALEVFRQRGLGNIQLILTDVIMPVMGGRELVEAISKESKDIKVIFTSGYTDDAILRQGITSGDINFIQKPFTQHLLAFKVREILDKK